MAGSIICGIDDSESAKGAARVARALSGKLGCGLVFVRVVENGAPKKEIGRVAARLERISGDATEVDCGADWRVEVGHPADRLVAAAAADNAAMIVVGSTGPRSSLLSSVSAEVSRRASCPVVVVPPEADANGRQDRQRETEFAGGIVRFALGPSNDGDSDFAGGIVRFSLGSGQH
jgi:nucleotide-binding universal stress UspA family protein